MKKVLTIIATILFLANFSGCSSMSWKSGWLQVKKSNQDNIYVVSKLLRKADSLILSADTKEEILEIIQIYEEVLSIDPENHKALSMVCGGYFLAAYAYSNQKMEKKLFYENVLKYSEQIMYINPDFKACIDNGDAVWVAASALSSNEMESIFLWYLACGAYWKECLNGFSKLINIKWIFRGKKMLQIMMDIDPAWAGGSPYYASANYYAVAPSLFGGDLKKADEYYKKAIEIGPNMLNFRRTRALFLHTKNNDRKAFIKDLKWVLAQNPHKVRFYLNYPYNIFLQRDSKYLLDNIDEYFN